MRSQALSYVFLALLSVISIAATAVLSDQIIVSYRSALSQNQSWARLVARYRELNGLAADVEHAGSDVFVSRNVAHDAALMESAYRIFSQNLHQATVETVRANNVRMANVLRRDLASVQTEIDESIAAGRVLAARLQAGAHHHEVVGNRQVMEDEFRDAQTALLALEADVQQMQQHLLDRQDASALSFEHRAELAAALVALVVVGAAGYGIVLSHRTTRFARALAVSEERFRQVVEGIQETFWMYDADSRRTVYVSPACYRMLGRSPSELCRPKLGWSEWIHPEDRSLVLDPEGHPRLDVTPGVVTYRVQHADGTTRWIRGAVTPMPDGKGRVHRLVGVMEDVTEQHERTLCEAETRRQKEVLEQQFRQAQKMEAVGRLAGGVAHDFNNLLTVISGFSELALQELAADDPVRHCLLEIERATQTGTCLTRQLLTFSRHQPQEPGVVSVNQTVTRVTAMLRRLIGSNCELEVCLDGATGAVTADVGHLEQILMNLVLNADDAMPDGGRITLQTRDVTLQEPRFALDGNSIPPGRYAVMSVSDTGTGIDPEMLRHIFEPFFTTKPVGKGTGLGLSTVFGIVSQNRGWIQVESAPGQGACFHLFFPATAEPEASPARPAPPPGSVAGGRTVLLVEDDAQVRRCMSKVLRARGYHTVEATCGDEAVRLCENQPERIDLCITDLMMPGRNGVDTIKAIAPQFPDMQVIYISGYTDQTERLREEVAAGRRFLQKPFQSVALLREVEDLLRAGTAMT